MTKSHTARVNIVVAPALRGLFAAAALVIATTAVAADAPGNVRRNARPARAAQPSAAKAAKSPAPAAAAAAAAANVTQHLFRVGKGAQVDLGWTGISHRQPWPSGQLFPLGLDCAKGSKCAVHTGGAGVLFGPPVPLSSGGIPVCVVNRLRKEIGGTFDVDAGCGDLTMHLDATVTLAQDTAQPCPVCVGDVVATDGTKGGTCRGGTNDGGPCDAEGRTLMFGVTSNDCPPSGGAIGTLPLDASLTTAVAKQDARTQCTTQGMAVRCACPGQTQPNACMKGKCAGVRCVGGPDDGTCDRAPYRSCLLGSGMADCEARFPGAGACIKRPRACFGEQITTTGVCDPRAPTFVASFCTPATVSSALNATTGLPGPGRLFLPLERIDAPDR